MYGDQSGEFVFGYWGLNNKGLTGKSWHVLKSQYTGGAQNKDFGASSQTDLTGG